VLADKLVSWVTGGVHVTIVLAVVSGFRAVAHLWRLVMYRPGGPGPWSCFNQDGHHTWRNPSESKLRQGLQGLQFHRGQALLQSSMRMGTMT
jgi:hypothetical protein